MASSSAAAASSSSQLPSWPPQLTQKQVAALSAQATDYALAHGIVYRPAGTPPSSTHVHHAPISLLPSPFPRSAFEAAVKLQPLLNELYARVALDKDFMTKVIGGNVTKVDDFTRRLWDIYDDVYVNSTGEDGYEWHLGLYRSDYLLHNDPSSSTAPSIRQVEFNTISSSFGPLCAKTGELHRFLFEQTGYYGASPETLKAPSLPRNTALEVLANGLAQAHNLYLKCHSGWAQPDNLRILIVTQDGERNAFDQRWLEYELLSKHKIRSMRRTFTSLTKGGILIMRNPTCSEPGAIIQVPDEDVPGRRDGYGPYPEISVVYWRAGYSPDDYKTEEHWELRADMEKTMTIKCPTVAVQLSGAKKVQQVLSEPGVVEKMLPGRSDDEIKALRATWSGLYPLDDSDLGQEGVKLAQTEPERFVMKPQREGGGNNVYRHDIPKALSRMEERDARGRGEGAGDGSGEAASDSASGGRAKRTRRAAQKKKDDGKEGDGEAPAVKEREGYILMELIEPPRGLGNYLVRPPAPAAIKSEDTGDAQTIVAPNEAKHAEGLTTAECRLSSDVVSELGIYGVALFSEAAPSFSWRWQRDLDEERRYSEPRAGPEDVERAKRFLFWESGQDDAACYGAEDSKGEDAEGSSSSSGGGKATIKAPYLLRTKGRESDEGGVAVGFSVLDSVVLV